MKAENINVYSESGGVATGMSDLAHLEDQLLI